MLIFFWSYHPLAQDGSAALNGVVEDISGARVASAAVTVANPENGSHCETRADASGNFSFAMLLPGHYVVTAWADGMATPTGASSNFTLAALDSCNCSWLRSGARKPFA